MDIAVYLALLVLIPLFAWLSSAQERRLKRLDHRIGELDRKTDLILRHMGIAQQDAGRAPELERVGALLKDGKKIQAIAAYREITGADLREAKEAVDRM
ncbi:hypothetical protein [Streptomyces albireticuli]|uniref:Ribosomal protein L7/L12 C-terminal domain-containing protein n=1 Tax=Streptomyces albireticuli TaxID=1940 RepID=A0A2A2D775_9ACTN|nr:hypothetical protein [Streptomyces albireticuli]MCD9142707.1 hypothetical protein [Streptomyces albireticuli]MCD9162974.1 hypothetical protein [Streptomyces albireticuli]MCD9192835.1 hypothetical protein [Streptomyces albireticuli]PAU47365.1 hypothetical protein CK936_19140 [Streptomyces albireticuli]